MRRSAWFVSALVIVAVGASADPIPPEQTLLDGGILSRYGQSVAIDGDRMVVGAPQERTSAAVPSSGVLHVYVRAGRYWVREARVVPAAPQSGAQFGGAVAISGDRLVATSGTDAAGGPGVYVFNRIGGVWQQETKIVPPATAQSYRVALDGDTLAVAAPGMLVQVYARGASWTLQQALAHALGSSCGASVALLDDRIVFGCPTASTNVGAAAVFRRNGTTWTLEQTLTPFDALTERRFGSAVALAGTDAVVGAQATDGSIIGTTARPGAVYTFTRSGTVWTPGPKLAPADTAPGDHFGATLDIVGDTLLVGAPFLVAIDLPLLGAAHVFVRQTGIWTERAKLGNGSGAAADYFGFDVALGVDTFVVGAHESAEDGNASGAAFHYTRAAIDGASTTSSEGGADDVRGTAVATAGDFLFVGGPNVEVGANTDQGVVTVYEKVAGNYVLRQTLTASDGVTGDKFGTAVAVNSSGSVVAIGAPGIDIGLNLEVGTGYVFERVGSNWTQVTRFPDVALGHRARGGAAIAVADDGMTIYLGAPNADQARGRVVGFRRTSPPPGADHAKGSGPWQIASSTQRPAGQQIGDKWGAALVLEGTMLAVGAPGAANASGDQNHGLVQVLKPSGAVMIPHTVEIRDAKVAGPDQTRFGTSVAFDGTDLAVGAPEHDVTAGPTMNLDQGVVETYTVSVAGTATPQQTVTAPAGRIGDKFGSAVASDGGVLVIGAPLADTAPSGPPVDGQGLVHVFRANRPPGGLVRWFEDIALTVPPSNPAAGDAFGSAVAIRAGTLALGAPRRDFPQTGPKQSVLVRDVGQGYAMPYVANLVFADGFE